MLYEDHLIEGTGAAEEHKRFCRRKVDGSEERQDVIGKPVPELSGFLHGKGIEADEQDRIVP